MTSATEIGRARSDALAARYGRTPGSRRRRLAMAIGVGGAVLATVVVWVIWVGLLGAGASFEARDTGFSIAADESVDIRFEVNAEPGTAVSCALQVLNPRFAIVGWKIVDLPPSAERTRAFEVNVRTIESPTTGLIYRCWLT